MKNQKLTKIWYYDTELKALVSGTATKIVEGPNTYYMDGRKLIRFPVFRSEINAIKSQALLVDSEIDHAHAFLGALMLKRRRLFAQLCNAYETKEKGSKKKSC